MARKNKGVALLLVGLVFLLVAGGWYCYNLVEDKNAGKQALDILTKIDDAQDNNDISPVITVGGDAFCGKVIIEKLNVELPVYNELSYARLKKAPCRYIGGVDTNDMIIAAHNYKSHFGSLKKLKTGDEIQFVDAYNKTHVFVVSELITLDGTAVSDMQSGGWDFTLFTCTKGGEQRVTVRCDRKNKG